MNITFSFKHASISVIDVAFIGQDTAKATSFFKTTVLLLDLLLAPIAFFDIFLYLQDIFLKDMIYS